MAISNQLRVIVVDDEKVIADSLVRVLQTHRIHACAAYDGLQAVAMADAFRPHAVISDVVLPGLDGAGVASYLAQHHPACRVLLFSGYFGIESSMEYHPHLTYPLNVLQKPIPPQQMLDFVDSCASQRLSRN